MSKRGGKRGASVDGGASVEEASVVVGVAAAAAVTAVAVAAVAAKEARVELWRRDEVVGLTASLFEKVEPFCIKKAELSVISVSKIVGGKGTFYPARCVDIHSREIATMYLNEKQVALVGLSNGMRMDVEDAYATVEAGGTSKAGYAYGPKIKINAYPYDRPHGKGTLGDYAKLTTHPLPNGQIRFDTVRLTDVAGMVPSAGMGPRTVFSFAGVVARVVPPSAGNGRSVVMAVIPSCGVGQAVAVRMFMRPPAVVEVGQVYDFVGVYKAGGGADGDRVEVVNCAPGFEALRLDSVNAFQREGVVKFAVRLAAWAREDGKAEFEAMKAALSDWTEPEAAWTLGRALVKKEPVVEARAPAAGAAVEENFDALL